LSLLVVLAALVFSAFPAYAAANNAKVYVVHGINGVDLGLPMDLPVDILVEGVGCAVTNFTFTKVAGPLALPAGTYNIEIKLADANPCAGATAIGPAPFTFDAGKTYSVVAHLTAAGAPTASSFVNNTSKLGRGLSRISLAHAAFAPEVDIYLKRGGRGFSPQVLEDVPNGAFATLDVRAGRYSAWLNLANTDTTVFGPANLLQPARRSVLVFIVGSAANGLYPAIYSYPMR